jgi:hypothetical protein
MHLSDGGKVRQLVRAKSMRTRLHGVAGVFGHGQRRRIAKIGAS